MKACSWGFDIDGNLDWRGTNQTKATSLKIYDIASACKPYDEDLKKLIKDIDNGVDRANAKIQSLYSQRNGILADLRSLGA